MVVLTEYEKRNIQVATAYGLVAGLESTLNRASARKDCPQWLAANLTHYIGRAKSLIPPLVEYKDEKQAGGMR